MVRSACLSFLLGCAVVLASATDVVAQDKPLLSQEILTVLQRSGPAAAQQRFNELFPAHKDEYVVDMDGFGTLAGELAQGGDYEGAQAIGMMAAAIVQDMAASGNLGGAFPGMPPVPPADQQPRREERQAPATASRGGAPSERDLMGEPRTDLDRFVGMYGDPDQQGGGTPPRNFYAAKRCDGYLVVGATWGDASPWYMRSTADLAFEARLFADNVVHVTFQMAPDGSPRALTHDMEGLDSPMQYLGPLPDGYVEGGCMQPPIR